LNKIGKTIVTQQMIAQAAGVHLSTVSLALRNDTRLPETTRKRINDVAKKLGYSPNPLVSLLMSRVRRREAGYRGTLGYIHTMPPDTPRLKGRVHQNFLAGARKRAADLGYNLDEFFFTPALSMRRLVEMLQTRNIAGLVIEHMPSALCPNRTLPFDIAPFAAVSIGVPLASPSLHYVANDQYMRAVLAARELLALGYRRMGLVIYNTFDSAMAHRCSAGFWAVQEYIPGLDALPICRIDESDVRGLRAWIARHKPDAILSSHHSMATMLKSLDVRVPEDIGWAHLDWLPEFKPAAGVYGNSEHTGAAAVELVVSQLHRGEAGPPDHAMSYLVSGTWQPGKTVTRVGPAMDLDTAFFSDLMRT
jgi:LacI family transcriptional regulator